MTILRVTRNWITRGNTVLLRVLSDAIGVADSATAIYVPAGGAVADGDSVVRTGPAATIPTRVEWLGGLGGAIDSAEPDEEFARANWTKSFTTESRMRYTTERPLSRATSLHADNHWPTSDGRKTWYYDYGASGVTQEYRSCNFYCDNGVATQFQWKIWRGSYVNNESDGSVPNWYIASWLGGPGAFFAHFNTDDGGNHTTSLATEAPLKTWFRMEVFWTSGTVNTADGSARIRFTRISDGEVLLDVTQTGKEFRSTADAVYRYAIWQNYLGNATPGETQLDVYMDDIYMSAVSSGTGAFVRAELIDSDDYDTATKFAICEVEDITGTDWTVKLNKGPYDMADLTHLAMFDASGAATVVAL